VDSWPYWAVQSHRQTQKGNQVLAVACKVDNLAVAAFVEKWQMTSHDHRFGQSVAYQFLPDDYFHDLDAEQSEVAVGAARAQH